MEGYFEAIDMNDGDESSSVQAWTSNWFEPKVHTKPSKNRPNVTYEIDYVYGARMEDSRKNVHINSYGKVVYMAGSLGIVLDPKTKEQRFFGGGDIDLDDPKSAKHFPGHTDEILCLQLNDDRSLAASGQLGNRPYVFLWDPNTAEVKTRIKMNHGVKGIRSLWFSPEGDKLACLDITEQNRIWIYDIATHKLLKVVKTDLNKKFDVDWTITPDGDHVIGVAGMKNAKFIKSADSEFKDTQIEFGVTNRLYIADHACICFDEFGSAYTGTQTGFLIRWTEYKDVYKVDAQNHTHLGGVHTLKWCERKLFSGSSDLTIKVSDLDFEVLCVFQAGSTVRSVDFHKDILVYSTKNGGIFKYDVDIDDLEFNNGETLMKSHFATQECGLIIQDNKIYTCGDDNQLFVRDMKTHQITGYYKLNEDKKDTKPKAALINGKENPLLAAAAHALDHHNEEIKVDFESDIDINVALDHIAISFTDGLVLVKQYSDPSKLLFKLTNAKKSCEWVEYSPDSEKLAVGSHDHKIYLYICQKYKYDLSRIFEYHSGGLIAIDWSIDSRFLRTNWDKNELVFWNIMQKKYIAPETWSDVIWSAQNCKLSWPTQGVFPYGASPDIVNWCSYDEFSNIIATGDDNGRVNIFNNPWLVDFNKERTLRGHSGHVGRVAFTNDGEYLITVGGYDRTIIQWKRKQL